MVKEQPQASKIAVLQVSSYRKKQVVQAAFKSEYAQPARWCNVWTIRKEEAVYTTLIDIHVI